MRWELLGRKYKLGHCELCNLFAKLEKITWGGKTYWLCAYCIQSAQTGKLHRHLKTKAMKKRFAKIYNRSGILFR